jgi:uncharacterized protein YcbK (DUF882 family)
MTRLTKNFTLEEFACKDGNAVPPSLIPNVQKLADQLQILRDELGEPIHVNSGYRTPTYNKKIGGKPASQHLQAKAADITVKCKSPRQLKTIVEKLITEGKLKFGGVGLYPGFLHVDIRRNHARW